MENKKLINNVNLFIKRYLIKFLKEIIIKTWKLDNHYKIL